MRKNESSLPLKDAGGDPGTPRSMLPKGSPEWCYRTIDRLRYALEEIQLTESHYDQVVEELIEYRAWERIPDPVSPYGSLDAMLKAELGLSSEEARTKKVEQQAVAAKANPILDGEELDEARRKGGRAGGRGNKKPSLHCNEGFQGNDSTYLSRRIARDRPDILERMKAGEFKSVRSAALEAGIVKPEISVPLEPQAAARRLLNRFKGEDLLSLVRILARHAGLDLLRDGELVD